MDNYLDVMREYVLVPREQYNELIALQVFANEALKEKNDILSKCKSVYANIVDDAHRGNEALLDILFKEERMNGGYDSREEQTNLASSYFGFSDKARKFLNSYGFDDDYLVKYINRRWDDKQKQEEK